MPIKTEVETLEKSTVVLKVEVPFDELGESIDRAYRDISKKVKIPGFRKGKTPKSIIDQMVGKEAVFHEALNEMVSIFYVKAVESSGIEPVTRPQVDIVQIVENQPLIFKAKVEVKPEVKLGSYDEIEIDEIEQAPVSQEVDEQVRQLRDKFATLEVVKNRPTEKGDFVLIDYEGYINDEPFAGGRGSDFMLELGSGTFIPDFEDQLVGADADSDVELKLTFPESYQTEQLAGREAVFKVKIKEIKIKKAPAADDDFAKSVSKFDTMKGLKDDIERAVTERLDADREAETKSRAVDKIVELSEVELPAGMVVRRTDRMIQNFAVQIEQTQKVSFENWLKESGIDHDVLQETYSEEAKKNLKTEAVIEAIIKDKNLEATNEDLENEIAKLADDAKQDVSEVKKRLADTDGYDWLKYRVSMNKAADLLVSKAKIRKKDDEDELSTDSD